MATVEDRLKWRDSLQPAAIIITLTLKKCPLCPGYSFSSERVSERGSEQTLTKKPLDWSN